MHFYLIGIDYKSAGIEAREALYRDRERISRFWESRAPHGTAMLVTCNRIEIYGMVQYPDDAFGHIAGFSKSFPGFARYGYTISGEAQVFRHALRLASGLESQLKGESQILAQLNAWTLGSNLPSPLKGIWDKVIPLAEKIRMASRLNEDTTDIAMLVFDDIREQLGHKRKYEIIVVGTGKISELFAKHRPPRMRLTFMAHKNYERAQALAGYAGDVALPLRNLPYVIGGSDVLISATSSPHYVVKKDHFDKRPVNRGNQFYVYDLAVPRDVEPAAAELEGVCAFNLDSLGRLFYSSNESKQDKINLASDLVEEVTGAYREVIHGNNS